MERVLCVEFQAVAKGRLRPQSLHRFEFLLVAAQIADKLGI